MENKQDINNTDKTETVHITEEQKRRSGKLKKEVVKTIRQQAVYRDAQNLFFVLAQTRKTCPVNFRAVLETLYLGCNAVLVALSLAYSEPASRVNQLTIASAHLDAVRTSMGILRSMGCMSRDDYKKAKSLAESCTKQVLAWRASSRGLCPAM